MSFMFHPYPYSDPRAVNRVDVPESVSGSLVCGTAPAAGYIAREIASGKKRVGIGAYPGAQLLPLINQLRRAVPELIAVDAAELLLPPDDINAILAPYLPEDRSIDPVLLYGRRFTGGYGALQDEKALERVSALMDGDAPVVVYGQGALCDALLSRYDLRVWVDITPRQAVLNFKNGLCDNLGSDHSHGSGEYGLVMRRCYYVDFELAFDHRWKLIRGGEMDAYIAGDDPENVRLLPFCALRELFAELNRRPFRCRPVYLEGVWGGWYIHRLRRLPKEMRNCAWVFDLIPMEVSLAADIGGVEFEVPFYTFIQAMGEKLLGRRAFEKFGGYFPIRFNYDDTFHSSGNMSIQCHPDAGYVVPNHGELGRQDESYYVCVTGQGAKTFLGFREETSCSEFLELAGRAERTGELIDYEKYVDHIESRPGVQLMIPAGTIHASGRNQLILEIGSLTVGSYTYKLYDYQRIDPQTGRPRPIHLKMGEKVLHGERCGSWVRENLVDHGYTVREGEGWREVVKGEHELLYFSLRNLVFERSIDDDTNGDFHVLALVDGERVRIESAGDPSLFFELEYLDIAVVPACFGSYHIVNLGGGTVTVHKTLLKQTGRV